MKKAWLTFLFIAVLSVCARQGRAQLIIANSSVKSADVSKGDLKDVFTGAASSLKDGSHVTPVLQKPGAASEEFLAAYIGKADAAFRATWRSLVFSGQGTMPKTVDSDAAMVAFVGATPGTIGYISKAAAHEGVKVLPVK
jgi:hypothetical protein